MLHYHQITPGERYTLATLRRQVPRLSQAEMARLMDRHPSTISRELRRNSTPTMAITAGHALRSKPTDAGLARDGTAGSPTSNGNWLSNSSEPTSAPSRSAAGSDVIRCSASAMKPSTSASGRSEEHTSELQ